MDLYTVNEAAMLEKFIGMGVLDVIDNLPVANQVAKLALSKVQDRLPQWGCSNSEERLELGRKNFSKRHSQISLLPQFLFMINWADTAPGISWPESYSVTFFPGIERFIVTASMDSPDMWGFTDLAIGSFPANENMIEGSGEVIKAWWSMQCSGDQECWAYVWNEGKVTTEVADLWACQVWIEPELDEDGEQ